MNIRRNALPWPLLVLAAASIVAVHSSPAQDGELGPPPGLIVDADAIALDERGQPILDAVPGARAAPALPGDVEQRLLELSDERAEIGLNAAAGAAQAAITPLAGEAAAPSRRDSTDRDPDRLRSAPALPRR